jgi:hypothetical protein
MASEAALDRERPVIGFLTDFGLDGAAAICRGVMLSIARDAQIIDISHTVTKYAIRDAAYLLASAVPWLPVGVHVAVVDPGVGTDRRPIALLTARGDILVGPDNGLLLSAARRLGGVTEARTIENRAWLLPTTSSTFHGRDIFAPVAAHLAAGTPIGEVGPAVAVGSLVPLAFPAARVHEGGLDTSVLFIDTFGNARIGGDPADLAVLRGHLEPGDQFAVRVGADAVVMPWQATFGEAAPGQPLLYEDADYAGLAIAVNQGSAADLLGLETDTAIRIEPA